MDFFDLDMAVYQFCKNDLGDQIREIKQQANLPYAIYRNGELEIDDSFRERKNRGISEMAFL
jgi:hypothetical protein